MNISKRLITYKLVILNRYWNESFLFIQISWLRFVWWLSKPNRVRFNPNWWDSFWDSHRCDGTSLNFQLVDATGYRLLCFYSGFDEFLHIFLRFQFQYLRLFFFWRICEQWIIQKILHFPGSVWMLLTVALRQWNLRTQRTSNLQFIESIIQLNFPVLFIWDKRQVHEIHKIPHFLIHYGKYVRSIQPTLWSS